ncbi:MAG: tetratricopeptide repeat protein [Acidobacteria bacterium]|nr:tetratricopeptide repeat protein [Acidobacteriota bacterium]
MRVLVVTIVAVALLLCTPAAAQMELGVIKGQVVDEGGAPLPSATIKLVNVDRGREVTLTTDKNGRFYRRGLQAVEYEMSVEKDGYQPIKDTVRLVAGVERDFDFKLAKGTPVGAKEFQEGVAAFNAGDFQKAATAFEAAVRNAPEIPDLHVNLALAYMRLNRQADAIASLEKAAALSPNDPKVHYQLGSAYIETQAYDKAVQALEKGLSSRPDLAADPLALEATSSLGAVYFARGEMEKAEQQFSRVLAVRPGAAGATLGMGKLHFSRGEVQQALAQFDKVVADHPGTPEAAQAETFIKELRKKGEAL